MPIHSAIRAFARSKNKLAPLIAVAAAVLFVPLQGAIASTSTGGYVSDISIGNDGNVWFAYSGTRNGNLPACADPNGLWVFSTSTVAGQAMLSALLSASARHQVVNIQGTGSCINSHESIAFIVIPGQ